MQKFIEKLHFITHDLPLTHVEQAQILCNSGAKWIQYRCLTKDDASLLEDINQIAEICDDWGATLIVTDHIQLAGKADIQGFHIEDMGADFRALRDQLGDAYTIGGSSNTIQNLLRIAEEGADYAGFGPFSISLTKPNNFELISLEIYKKAVNEFKKINVSFPILAVGGIKLPDVNSLLQTGIYGVAASAAINCTENPGKAYEDFYRSIADFQL